MVFYRPPEPIEPKRVPEPMPEMEQDFSDEEQAMERPESEKRIRWLQEPNDKFSDGISDLFGAPEREPEGGEKWTWIGDKRHPDGKESSDGISDLFEVNEDDLLDDPDDVTDLDYEVDVLDAGEDGTLDDLVNVSQEDVMGSPPQPSKRRYKRTRRLYRPSPPTGLGGMRR